MDCGNALCIYYEKGTCALSEICLDTLGICASCIQVVFSDAELEKKRRALRNKPEGLDSAKNL